MRIVLSASIVCWHSIVTSYGDAAQTAVMNGWPKPFIAMLLPCFFALSGFLVGGSLERCKTIGMFLGLRAIRIYPALAVESLISALLVGPVLTTLPITDYVLSPTFHSYFLNILGIPHYLLPGVFESNPLAKVNGQLWTVPFELECYVALAVLAVIGVVKSRRLLALAILGYMALYAAMVVIRHGSSELTALVAVLPGNLLVVSFLTGVLIYRCRDWIVWDWRLATLTLVAALALVWVPLGKFATAILLSYPTVYFGLCNPKKISVLKGADYSYGVFLYGFCIQQVFVSLGPWTHHWWLNIAVCLPTATLVAALSWHFVEKPALGWRKQLVAVENWWLSRRPLRRVEA